MKLTKSALLLFTCISMIVFSMLLAKVTNLLNTNPPHKQSSFSSAEKLSMNNKIDHLIWFLQISDIHISIFRDPDRITEFKEFCDYTIKTFKPPVVLASGDLTDAKTSDNIGSQQIHGEWFVYYNILRSLNISSYTTWLDIRGNHDNFNVRNLQSKENYFSNFSVQGLAHPRSYYHQIKHGGDVYSFVGIDACLQPGPKRPFNFVGLLEAAEISTLKNIVKNIDASNSNYTIWFGHYPTSCILSREEGGVRSLIGKHKNGLAYLCGHLHTLGGFLPNMYTLQQDGFLELELGDWKDNRLYRLLAIDHGLLSFIDVKHQNWPVVLITNPKHALFVIHQKEDLNIIRDSTHIRLLAFSIAPILSVRIQINNEDWIKGDHIDGPLYVAHWDPNRYSIGLHEIKVQVSDVDGRSRLLNQPFSLDGTRLSFDLLPRLALMTNASSFFKLMFAIFNTVLTIPLLLLKIIHYNSIKGDVKMQENRKGFFRKWLRKLWVLVSVDKIFWPLVMYPIYLTIGPWSIGYIVEDQIGAIFAWGIYVDGVFLPGSFTYAYGFIQLLSFQLPLTLVLAHGLDYRVKYLIGNLGMRRVWLTKVGLHLPFIAILTAQLLMAYFFWLAYGTLAFLIGPLRTWSIFIAVVLWLFALSLPEKYASNAIKIWWNNWDQERRCLNLRPHVDVVLK